MKTVQGVSRQYQLVDKTKRRDLDGVVYLVAGERNLWVKLLKDRSDAKRNEIINAISIGRGAGFVKPLEAVSDAKGFAGYTFIGPEMEVVPEKIIPEKTVPDKSKKQKQPDRGNQLVNQPGNFGGGMNPPPVPQPRSSYGLGAGQILILTVTGAVMFALTLLFLDKALVSMIYMKFSAAAGDGCRMLSFGGIVPSIAGVAGMIFYHKSFGRNIEPIPIYILFGVVAFLCGASAAYAVVGVFCVLAVGIFGVVKAYQTVIITVLVLLFLVKMIFSGR